MFLYYRFITTYHRDPVDADDLFDGLRNIAAENAIYDVLAPKGK